MLILAGVSINAIVGEDGVLTKAQAASIASRKASILEELNLELASYNIDSILKSPEETKTMLENLITKGLIDTVLSSSSEYVENASEPMGIPQFDDANNYTGYIDYSVKKEDYSIIISIDDSGIYKAAYGDVNISSGGSVASGTTLVTDKAFTNNEGAAPEEQGKFVIDNDASVMFVDRITGELSIQVKSGTHAKVYAFKDMTLTNSGIKRSAIDIESGGTLDLYVAEGATVTVNSGFGEDAVGNTAGKGGYAGIHVPWNDLNNDNIRDDGEYAILNLYGGGTVKAIGGDAGKGDYAGGGGAGAGIGGNGGKGATHKEGVDSPDISNKAPNGGVGEDAGNININNSIIVYAYGGAGGDGCLSNGGGSGSGGYPAAGIGGGGAGGAGSTCCSGAGGYTGGNGSTRRGSQPVSHNGLSGAGYTGNGINPGDVAGFWGSGGGYYEGSKAITQTGNLMNIYGGMSAPAWWTGHQPGNGGTAGKGGNVKVSSNSQIYAFNGNRYTDGTDYKNGENEAVIYYQNGINIERGYTNRSIEGSLKDEEGSYSIFYQTNPKTTFAKTGYVNHYFDSRPKIITINEMLTNVDLSNQGIGSGAGYIELSNGTYTVDSSMN